MSLGNLSNDEIDALRKAAVEAIGDSRKRRIFFDWRGRKYRAERHRSWGQPRLTIDSWDRQEPAIALSISLPTKREKGAPTYDTGSLHAAAIKAWGERKPRQRKVRFIWNGDHYVMEKNARGFWLTSLKAVFLIRDGALHKV